MKLLLKFIIYYILVLLIFIITEKLFGKELETIKTILIPFILSSIMIIFNNNQNSNNT